MKSLFFIIVLSLSVSSCVFSEGKNENIGLSGDLMETFEMRSQSSSLMEGSDKNGALMKMRSFPYEAQDEAWGYAHDRVSSIFSMYDDVPSPYPGMISDRIHCDEQFLPQRHEGAQEYYTLFSSSRQTYGACSKDTVAYTSLLFFTYCKESKLLYQTEIFVPLSKSTAPYESSIPSISCIGTGHE